MTETIVELMSARAYGKDIGIACTIAPDVPARISADPGRLRQVLLNLIGNAIKFTDTGGVWVSVSMQDCRAIRFEIRDTGPGFSDADRVRIFQEFEQADDGPTRRHGGAGLGLAISKRIVDAMAGAIDAESRPGRGSVFTVTIPVEILDPAPAETADALSGRSVLVVSRNLVEAEAVAAIVVDHGGTAAVASSPDAAVARLTRGWTGDVLMIDAACEREAPGLLQRLLALTVCPCNAVVLIAPNDRGILPDLKAGGYSGFLARPVRGETLVRILVTQLGAGAATRSGPVVVADPVRGSGGLSVLLAEDNEINALLARAALGRAGHTVTVVGNGKAALDAVVASVASGPFDVVLMDLHMPVMDGMTAIAQIRRHEELTGARPVPILVLSADSQEETRSRVLAHGADGFVTKPIDPVVLADLVSRRAAA